MDIQDGIEKRDIAVARRLTCRIPEEADRHLSREILRLDSKKGRTMRVLMELAIAYPDHPSRNYENGSTKPCSLDAAEDWLTGFAAYRRHHGLWQNTGFFHDALLRGLSIRLDGVA